MQVPSTFVVREVQRNHIDTFPPFPLSSVHSHDVLGQLQSDRALSSSPSCPLTQRNKSPSCKESHKPKGQRTRPTSPLSQARRQKESSRPIQAPKSPHSSSPPRMNLPRLPPITRGWTLPHSQMAEPVLGSPSPRRQPASSFPGGKCPQPRIFMTSAVLSLRRPLRTAIQVLTPTRHV